MAQIPRRSVEGADRDAIREETRADREAFEKHITRLIQSLPPA